MKKVIYVKSFEDGRLTKREKTCKDFVDLARTFDECVGSFRDFCEKYGDFQEDDLCYAEGHALGMNCKVMVIEEK